MEAAQGCIGWGGGGAVWWNVGKVGTPRSRNQGWWTEEVAKAVGEKRKAWRMMIEGMRDRGGTTHRLKAPVWPEEEGSQKGG